MLNSVTTHSSHLELLELNQHQLKMIFDLLQTLLRQHILQKKLVFHHLQLHEL